MGDPVGNGSRWVEWETCRCPRCRRMHTDLVMREQARLRKNGQPRTVRQECNTCLEARAGGGALEEYLRWKESVTR